MSSEGNDKSIGSTKIGVIREIYKKVLEQPEPKEAIDLISNLIGE